jgi:Na+/proline symporter
MLRNRILGTVAVLAHLAVMMLHGQAHDQLSVGLSSWQNIYVLIVIAIAPLVAMVLLWTRFTRQGLLLLVVSMAASLIFGLVYHYIVVSPDHVSHLPPGDAQGQFRITAALLILTELFGVVVGLLGLRSDKARP